jgi:chromosome segregation ATPase
MDAYVRRITNVTNRLESRANKLEATGLDVSAARTKIADARTELEKAQQNLATIDSAVAGFVGSENPRTYWQQVKNTYLATSEAIKSAHRATVETLLLLKTAVAPAPTATTTESAQNNVE